MAERMGRRLKLGWSGALCLGLPHGVAITICFLLLLVFVDPFRFLQGETAGVVESECIQPTRYKDGTCGMAVRLDDGRQIGVTGVSSGRQYKPGDRVTLLVFKTMLHRHTKYEVKQVAP